MSWFSNVKMQITVVTLNSWFFYHRMNSLLTSYRARNSCCFSYFLLRHRIQLAVSVFFIVKIKIGVFFWLTSRFSTTFIIIRIMLPNHGIKLYVMENICDKYFFFSKCLSKICIWDTNGTSLFKLYLNVKESFEEW